MAGFAVLGLVGIAYALCASRLERVSVSGPLVFTAAGLALGPAGLSRLDVPASAATVKTVTELTLALLLFADASTVGLRQLRRNAGLPTRLLTLGLPLTIVLGAVVAHLVLPGVSWSVAALIAAILAPTDAALSLAVVTNPRVPLLVRTTLNVESGLNDGIASPIVAVLIAVVAAEESPTHRWLTSAVKEIGVALAVAIVLGAVGGWLAEHARRSGWTTPLSDQLVVLAMALVTFEVAVSLGGNGFVAAFVAGLLFGAASGHELSPATEYTETTGLFLSYAVWALFGAVLVGPLLKDGWHTSAFVYAILSLTVVRMIPVALSLLGTGLDRSSLAFIGWFGPRGLASIVFLIVAAHDLHLGAADISSVESETIVWTIFLSVVVHGLTAAPFSTWYGTHETGTGTDRSATSKPRRAPRTN